jgi:hypothetical protein
MATKGTGTFQVKSWDEKPADDFGGVKLTRARVKQSYEGDFKGDGTVEYLMTYGEGGAATFVGFERVVGSVGGKSGSFILQHGGVFENDTAKSSFEVVSGSGTEGMKGIRGKGNYVAGHAGATFTFEFNFV